MDISHLNERRTVFLAGFLLILIHYLIFSSFLPNHQGRLGHDYAFFLPALLDGFYWYQSNGLLSVPWFTPSFCGGIPFYPHPANPYFFVPQFLTFLFDPLTSIKLTLFIFASLGFWGFYLLSRKILSLNIPVSLLTSALFLFNGFFSHRLLIGHLEFHPIMLIPFCAFYILNPTKGMKYGQMKRLFNTAIAGVIIAYILFSGMGQLILPILLSIILMCLMSAYFSPGIVALKSIFFNFFLSCIIALGLSASKIVATLSFLNNFPRSDYPLPGFSNLYDLVSILFQ